MFPPYLAMKLKEEEQEHSQDVLIEGAIMDGGARKSHTVEEVFNDFRGRRAGLITALTDDFELLCSRCDRDPDKGNLCLYGYPNGQWEVDLPTHELPSELPEPVLGLNFCELGIPKKHWSLLVASHSDAWLLSVAFHFGAKFGFDKSDRKRLFDMINDLPTVLEVVIEGAENKAKDDSSGNESMPLTSNDDNGIEDDDDEDGYSEENNPKSEFGISCETCHGNHLKISPPRAVHIKQYECPDCSNKGLCP